MNIGIDLDGVLTDIQDFNCRHAPLFFKERYNREVANETPYDIRDIFKCPEDEYKAYWRKYLLRYAITEPARKGARKVTHALYKDNNSIYIISKRVFTSHRSFIGMLMRFIVHNWLWRNGIRYNDIVFCDNDVADSKYAACKEKSIDVMVDDEPVNINAIAMITKVICFKTSYNRDCKGENIYRAHNWDEVHKIVKRLSNQ